MRVHQDVQDTDQCMSPNLPLFSLDRISLYYLALQPFCPFGTSAADWLSEIVGYLFQALGLLLFSLTIKKRPQITQQRSLLTYAVLADGFAMVVAILSSAQVAVLVFGLLMNLFHGVIAGIYLTKLARCIPRQNTGATFGIAYGLGSIGSWLLSLLFDGSFLQSNLSLIIYGVLIIATVLFERQGRGTQNCLDNKGASTNGSSHVITIDTLHPPCTSATDGTLSSSDIFHRPEFVLAALAVILMSVIKGLGFYFPLAESSGSNISLEFSRAFYALGLIAAGFLNDKNENTERYVAWPHWSSPSSPSH